MSDEQPLTEDDLAGVILLGGLKEKASDIHLEAEHAGIRVRYRIDGLMYDVAEVPRALQRQVLARIFRLARLDSHLLNQPQEGTFSLTFERRRYDMRVNTLPVVHGQRLAIKIFDAEVTKIGLANLGFSDSTIHELESSLTKKGLLLITGSRGNGRTVTLHNLLHLLSRKGKRVAVLEEEATFQDESLERFPITKDLRLHPSRVLERFEEQGFDAIAVDETVAPPVLTSCFFLAARGILVLAVTRSRDTVDLLMALLHFGFGSREIDAYLLCILAQKLVRRLCPDCRVPYVFSAEERARLNLPEDIREPQLYTATGCDRCRFTGYRGRIPLAELLLPMAATNAALARAVPPEEIRRILKLGGTKFLLDDGIQKILEGVTSADEILRCLR